MDRCIRLLGQRVDYVKHRGDGSKGSKEKEERRYAAKIGVPCLAASIKHRMKIKRKTALKERKDLLEELKKIETCYQCERLTHSNIDRCIGLAKD